MNLSGPACGLECASLAIPVDSQHETSEENHVEFKIPSKYRSELCQTLCDNGLGVLKWNNRRKKQKLVKKYYNLKLKKKLGNKKKFK